MTINQPVRELLANVSEPFESARAMPPSVYTNPEFLKSELDERLFARDWVCVGRASALAKPGDYLVFELAGEPILVLRDDKGQLRAMSNVCRHRMSTILEGSGNKRAIVCPYHGWSYNLDGSLRAAPAMELNRGFCKDDYRLPEIRCEEWLGWVMVTLAEKTPSAASQLAEVEALIDDYQMQNYVETVPRDACLGHQLEDSRRKFHGELSSPGLPRRHHRRPLQAQRNGLPAGATSLQLSHDPQRRHAQDRARASRQHAA